MKTFLYCAMVDAVQDLGVVKKLEHTIAAINRSPDHYAALYLYPPSARGAIGLVSRLLARDCDALILRLPAALLLFATPALVYRRLTGCRIIIDVPTPFRVAVSEALLRTHSSRFSKAIKIMSYFLNAPIGLLSAHRIIQYAEESSYFQVGVKHKTVLMGNGVDVNSLKLKRRQSLRSGEEFVLIGVSTLTAWQGYDRIIRSLAAYRQDNKMSLRFIVVGDGPERRHLELMAKRLGLTDTVDFTGRLSGHELDDLFDISHVAVGTLGAYRKQLMSASILKAREYTARGIPFITAVPDADFSPTPFFVYECVNDSSDIALDSIREWYRGISRDLGMEEAIRHFALQHLDFSHKVGAYTQVTLDST